MSKFEVITREMWGARPARSQSKLGTPERIVIHCSATRVTEYRGFCTIRAIQDYHMDRNRWADIGYHFLVSPDGKQVFEGRPLWANGAHCGGGRDKRFGNMGSIGNCVIGHYDQEYPDADMLETLDALTKRTCASLKIPISEVYGHVEAWEKGKQAKTCPGRYLFMAIFGVGRWRDQTGDNSLLPLQCPKCRDRRALPRLLHGN
jgi:hypothetical protein